MSSTAGSRADVDHDLWRRSAALWRIEPLVAVERSKETRPGNWSPFDLITLQAAALDRIMSEMGLMTGARLDDVHGHLIALARASMPAPHHSPTPEEVADVVLANLRNTDGQGRHYRREFTDYRDGGRKRIDFAFVRTTEADDGTFILRATHEAINLLLGALEHDLEHEQEALLLILDRQLASGQFTKAVSTAVTSRERTKQYVESVRAKLEDIQRDVSATPWFGDVDRLLDTAEGHLRDQMTQNRQIRRRAEELIDAAEDAAARSQLDQLLAIVTDTYSRNLELQKWLARVGGEFRQQQDRQVYTLRRSTSLLNLADDVFEPLALLPVPDAAPTVAAFTHAVTGPHRERVFDISTLVARLLTPAREIPSEVAEAVERDFEQVDADPVRFDADTIVAAEKLLATVGDQPVRLSRLLSRAEHPNVAAVVWADATARFAPEGDFDDGGTTVIAFDDGHRFADGRFGGADLLLVRIPTPDRFVPDEPTGPDPQEP